MIESVLFYTAAFVAVGAAAAVVLANSPLRSALALIVSLCGVALLFLQLDATFLAAMQVLVYAGAIVVLFVFVIMMLNLAPNAHVRPAYVSVAKLLGSLAALYFAWRVARAATGGLGRAVDGSVRSIGQLLLSDYLFGFEAVSLVLLVAVVGAVVLGLKRLT